MKKTYTALLHDNIIYIFHIYIYMSKVVRDTYIYIYRFPIARLNHALITTIYVHYHIILRKKVRYIIMKRIAIRIGIGED
jgi:hypothetical protein